MSVELTLGVNITSLMAQSANAQVGILQSHLISPTTLSLLLSVTQLEFKRYFYAVCFTLYANKNGVNLLAQKLQVYEIDLRCLFQLQSIDRYSRLLSKFQFRFSVSENSLSK